MTGSKHKTFNKANHTLEEFVEGRFDIGPETCLTTLIGILT